MSILEEESICLIVPVLLKSRFAMANTQIYINRVSNLLGNIDWIVPPEQVEISGLAGVFVARLTLEQADLLEANNEFRVQEMSSRPCRFAIGDNGPLVFKS